MKTTLDSNSLKQYLAHEWPVKDAVVDKGLFGGKAAEQNKRSSRSRAALISSLSPSTFPFGMVFTKGCGISHLALVLEPKNLGEHLSDQRAFSFSLPKSGSGG